MFTFSMKKPVQVFSFSIQNSTTDEVDIHIDGDIVDASTQAMIEAWFGDTTSTSYKSFRNALDKVKAQVYNIIINSPGGHVGDALAMHDLLRDMQDNKGKVVNTIGRGIVASSATLLLLAGNSPRMSANSWFMMHTVSGGTYGTVDQVENYAVTMRKFNDKVRDLYSEKSGLRKEDVTKLMNAETWLTADDAKLKGFISNIDGKAEFTNLIPKEQWDYANTAVLNSYNASVKPTDKIEDMKKYFEDMATSIMNAIKGIKPTEPEVGKPIDQVALINSIADAMKKPFEDMGTGLEGQVGTLIANAIKPLEDKIVILETAKTELEGKNKTMETTIADKLGSPTTSKEKPAEVPVGSFN